MLLHPFVNGAHEVMHPTAIQKDTTFTKIFVGGLPYHTNDASLRKYFEAFGDIDEAVVITDRQTGKSRGYGFVSLLLFGNDFSWWCKLTLTRVRECLCECATLCNVILFRTFRASYLLVTTTNLSIISPRHVSFAHSVTLTACLKMIIC